MVSELLSALNTGHDGGCGTVHANAAADVPARLEALGSAAGLDRLALHSQMAAALDVVVHVVRGRDGRRRVAEVHVLERTEAGLVATVPAAVMGVDGGLTRGPGWPRLQELCLRGVAGAVGEAGEVTGFGSVPRTLVRHGGRTRRRRTVPDAVAQLSLPAADPAAAPPVAGAVFPAPAPAPVGTGGGAG